MNIFLPIILLLFFTAEFACDDAERKRLYQYVITGTVQCFNSAGQREIAYVELKESDGAMDPDDLWEHKTTDINGKFSIYGKDVYEDWGPPEPYLKVTCGEREYQVCLYTDKGVQTVELSEGGIAIVNGETRNNAIMGYHGLIIKHPDCFSRNYWRTGDETLAHYF